MGNLDVTVGAAWRSVFFHRTEPIIIQIPGAFVNEIETMATAHVKFPDILRDPEFKDLVRRKIRVSVALSLATMAVYYGFIFLIAFHKGFLARMVTENITLGIPLGLGVILATCLFTGIYVLWANRKYDPSVTALKAKLGNK